MTPSQFTKFYRSRRTAEGFFSLIQVPEEVCGFRYLGAQDSDL